MVGRYLNELYPRFSSVPWNLPHQGLHAMYKREV